MARRGTPFRGVLFAGLMMTSHGPQVLEFNVRFGDPETQALMALWDGDILPWLFGAARGQLPEGRPAFSRDHACCVVMASAGYPASSTKGVPIAEGELPEDVMVFHAGTQRDAEGQLQTAGGRVLGVTARADSLQEARTLAYQGVEAYAFEGAQVRSDIGARGLV